MSLAVLIQSILDEIAKHGTNLAPIPVASWLQDNHWWIAIDVNTPKRTFDIEVCNANQHTAYANALARVRREFSS